MLEVKSGLAVSEAELYESCDVVKVQKVIMS